MTDVAIVGVGIHPFGRHATSGMEQGLVAVRRALEDAEIQWSDVQYAFGGSMEAGMPDAMVGQLGLTTTPFTNVLNGCATGGSVLIQASNAIRTGAADVVLAVGFDKHPRGAFGGREMTGWGVGEWFGHAGMMLGPQFFALRAQRYMHDYGITPRTLAKVAAKAFRNGALNENAWRRTPVSEEEILAAPMIAPPLTKYMFCSPDEGAVAVVLCRGELASRFPGPPICLRAVSLRTRPFGTPGLFDPSWYGNEAGPTSLAAAEAFEKAGVGPDEIDVAQVQDTESGHEVIHLAECGFCKHGEQEELIGSGGTEIDGALPVNTDGGCIANGEPIGASGLRQVYECVLQLRGLAGQRQVPRQPKTAFTQVYGGPGVSACTVLSR